MNTNAPQALREKCDIPNQAGFMLHLVRPDGSNQLARVAVEGGTGCHYCATPSGKRISLGEFWGWVPYAPPVPFEVPGHKPSGTPHKWTRAQCRHILTQWGATESEPARGKAVIVAFPGKPLCLARVTIDAAKSTDGKTLFACQFYART